MVAPPQRSNDRFVRRSGLVEMRLTKLGRFELFRQESVDRRAFAVSLLNDTSAFCSRVVHQSCNPREKRSF